jgi:hypothetical protein
MGGPHPKDGMHHRPMERQRYCVRERVGLLVVLRGTANSVHQFGEPVVKVSIEFDTVRTSAILTRQLSNWRFSSSTRWFSISRLCLHMT